MNKSIATLVAASLVFTSAGAAEQNKPLKKFHENTIASGKTSNASLPPGLAQNPLLAPYGAILAATVWPKPGIAVCWENPSDAHKEAMQWTRDAVQQTWEKASRLRFTGWEKCSTLNKGIRIQIADEGPHVKKLGQQLNGKPAGMVLNFTFQNWSYNCQTSREDCIRAVAVHEFGHGIGFTHEQNRADTPGECKLLAQGTAPDTALTPFDTESVMNYCNKNWNNGGMLSAGDVSSVVQLYGAP